MALDNPDAHLPGLADAWHNLAVRLMVMRQRSNPLPEAAAERVRQELGLPTTTSGERSSESDPSVPLCSLSDFADSLTSS
ncbi:hypothetical protein [Streptomyces sp. NPDC058694]|uniref:hypothetical protein n=1 Tax=Streptomyces sp. NPDC058694 TaxID=3346603 RepID=UPI00365E4759